MILLLIHVARPWGNMGGEPCDWDAWWPGSSAPYRINTNDFTTSEEAAIESAADTWIAGSGEINRGADWEFHRVDVTTDGAHDDGYNNVRVKSDSWFDSFMLDEGFIAVTFWWPDDYDDCVFAEADVTFRQSVTWSTGLPHETTGSTPSIGYTALHELGHFIGLDHDNNEIAIMNAIYPFGGDISGEYRVSENDYVGLKAGYPDASTGMNLMLGRYEQYAIDSGTATELWTTSETETRIWEACPGDTLDPGDGPKDIAAMISTTGSALSVEVEWRLSADSTCFAGTEYDVGSVTPTIGTNWPFMVGPTGGFSIPSSTPANEYYLCACIDPNNDRTETSESDNCLKSEAKFEVLGGASCP